MKYFTLCTVAISLFCVATAVTLTAYSDATCGTVAQDTSGGTNPLVAPLNQCTKNSATQWVKFTSCSSNGKVAGSYYTDSGCNTKQQSSPDIAFDTDKCIPFLTASLKVTCAPASSATVALAAVAAAALLLFVQ